MLHKENIVKSHLERFFRFSAVKLLINLCLTFFLSIVVSDQNVRFNQNQN